MWQVLGNRALSLFIIWTVVWIVTDRKQVEEKLKKEKNKTCNYLDIADVILVALNKDGEVTLINKKGCEVLWYKGSKIIGKNWFSNFIPERLRVKMKGVSTLFCEERLSRSSSMRILLVLEMERKINRLA